MRIQKPGTAVHLIWIPAHTGVKGDELADKFAKGATWKTSIGMAVQYSEA